MHTLKVAHHLTHYNITVLDKKYYFTQVKTSIYVLNTTQLVFWSLNDKLSRYSYNHNKLR